MAFNIRRADASDAATVGIILPAAYAEAYSYLWSDSAAYARRLISFGREAFEQDLADPAVRLWVAEDNGVSVGLLKLIFGSADPITGDVGGAELQRVYLLSTGRRLGLGSLLLQTAINASAAASSRYIWLDLMDSAPWALSAYEKAGFRSIGKITFDGGVRPELSGMIVMRRDLDGSAQG